MEPHSQSPSPQQPPLATAVPYQPPPRPPVRPRSASRWVLVLLVLGLCGSVLLNLVLFGAISLAGFASIDSDGQVRQKHFSHRRSSGNKVAIISLEGTILSGEGFIKRQIDTAMQDESVRAVVLRVDSPGGTITGSDSVYHQLCELAEQREIPIVVSMGGLAASGGYYVSMASGQTGVIYAEPTTWTGSIGVIIPHYEFTGTMEKLGIVEKSIVSHRLKQTGSYLKEMTKEEEAILQELVDEGFDLFKDRIKKGRPDLKPAKLNELATGQIYSAKQAKDKGLIDRIGFLEDAVAKAIEMAELDEEDVTVVRYRREPNLADMLWGVRAKPRPLDLAEILDMTAPRAYFLCTALPPLVSSRP